MSAGKYIRTEEIKEKNRLGSLGKKRSEEWKRKRKLKYTGNGNPFFGKHHSEETRKKFSTIRRNIGLKENPTLSSIHIWVKRRKSKPKLCECCKKRKPFDLANISQKYKRDVNDYEWLCRKCHMTKDKRIKKNLKQYRLVK